jgi:hypothetical protein
MADVRHVSMIIRDRSTARIECEIRLCRPFRASFVVVRKHTQGVALGYLRVPLWGVRIRALHAGFAHSPYTLVLQAVKGSRFD